MLELFNRVGEVDDTAAEVGLNPSLLHSLVRQESGYDTKAVSPKGAVGTGQVMPATARDPGFGVKPFNPNDPSENLRGSAQYLKAMLDHYGGDETQALAAYNAGPGRVDRAGGVPNIPETQNYVKNILGRVTPVEANPNAPPPVNAKPPEKDWLEMFNSVEAPPVESPQDAVARLAKDRQATEGPGALSRGVAGAGKHLNPIDMVTGVASALAHPIKTAQGLGAGLADQWGQAKDQFHQGNYMAAAGHAGAAALPALAALPIGAAAIAGAPITLPMVGGAAATAAMLAGIGPAAATAGQHVADTGDIASGVGEGVGLVGSLLAPEAIGHGLKGAGKLASKAAERVINSNVKPNTALIKANPRVNIPRTILDEGFGPGERGHLKAAAKVESLSGELSNAVANAGGKGSLQPLLDHLDTLEEQYKHQPNPTADLAAVRQAREALMNNPLYSQEKIGTVMVPQQQPIPGLQQAQVPHGQPTTQTVMVPQQQVVGRELVDQPLPELDVMKKNVYAGLKGKFAREGAAAVESDKAMGRGLKDSLNAQVPAQDGFRSAHDINAQQSKVIVARNALKDMAIRETKKYPIGLMDLVAMSGGLAAGGPLGGALAPLALRAAKSGALLLKHPSTAFPIARGMDTLGKAIRGTSPLAKGLAAAAVAGEHTPTD